ncbi:hypothetical protein ACQCSX_22090 (plasmid) [Pseudarthrobacter sp. P1]|uniref:hypothetical protein n=1 Tax=Pseudarthrobacter sp. P1 TaxID=3418418 RepID=UPI003CF99286
MAAALAILALVRVPALRRNGRDTVFVAAVFEGAGALLMSPLVYFPLDQLLGGANLVKLMMHTLLITGLWFLRRAVLEAITPVAGDRPSWIRSLPLTLTLGLQTLFFVLTGPTVTTGEWGIYHVRPAGALFSTMLILFIGWICAEISIVCFRYVPQMRSSFRVGFSLVGAGCLAGLLVIFKFCCGLLEQLFPVLKPVGEFPNEIIHLMEMLAIVLVGAGLTIPAVAGRRARLKRMHWAVDTLAMVAPIRERVLLGASAERLLESDPDAPVQDRLHRMMVEIWDAELAAGEDGVLTTEERFFLLSVDGQLDLLPVH